ncbi:hypothetical protein [Kingella negevensis]|uniref:hypothetical protein n=1 Tax=Kingella negevensis TaxID=1522312 RepID=UPI00247317E2|nr:hypothetical protein [Kingella negevensis]
MLQKNRWSLYFDKSLAQLNFAQFALQLNDKRWYFLPLILVLTISPFGLRAYGRKKEVSNPVSSK